MLICSLTVAPDLAACTRTKLTIDGSTPFVGPVNRDGSRTRIHAALVPAGVFFVRSSVLVINSALIAGGSQVSPRGTGNHSEHVSTEGSYSLRQRARYEPHAQQDNDPCTEARSATTVFPDMGLPQPPIRVRRCWCRELAGGFKNRVGD